MKRRSEYWDVTEIKLKSRQKFFSWTNEWIVSRFIFNFCYEYRTDFKSNKPYSFIGIIFSTITLSWTNKFIFAFPVLSFFFSIFFPPPKNRIDPHSKSHQRKRTLNERETILSFFEISFRRTFPLLLIFFSLINEHEKQADDLFFTSLQVRLNVGRSETKKRRIERHGEESAFPLVRRRRAQSPRDICEKSIYIYGRRHAVQLQLLKRFSGRLKFKHFVSSFFPSLSSLHNSYDDAWKLERYVHSLHFFLSSSPLPLFHFVFSDKPRFHFR